MEAPTFLGAAQRGTHGTVPGALVTCSAVEPPSSAPEPPSRPDVESIDPISQSDPLHECALSDMVGRSATALPPPPGRSRHHVGPILEGKTQKNEQGLTRARRTAHP